MDDYPPFALDHNIPLLVILGLSSRSRAGATESEYGGEQGIQLKSDLPLLESESAAVLLRYIEQRDASGAPWNGWDARRSKFRVKASGRAYTLPPRRARLPDEYDAPLTGLTLHSPYSPLSPASHLYPDGLIGTEWLRKHQEVVPSAFLCFYYLTGDQALSTLHDNQIKTDINNIKRALGQSGHKCRLVVAILSDEVTYASEGTQTRLDNIRNGAGLDAKWFFFIPPKESPEELDHSADVILTTVYAQAIEHYRDLSKHSRAKKRRGIVPQPSVPPTSGTSQTTSLSGWNVRYDFKAGVFAEFRQEMDVARASYEAAYDSLLGSEVMEVIPSWSPRFNEARLLADMIAYRSIRCLIWNAQYTAAVRRWQSHLDRMGALVDNHGKGTNNYGWQAWEARWNLVMAFMIEKAEIPEFAPPSNILHLQPEKSIMGEHLHPWELLHHTGYWYRSAARHLYGRRTLAYAMPDEDRADPDPAQKSKGLRRTNNYDTYLCPEPHEEYPLERSGVGHAEMILESLRKAEKEFRKRQQMRTSAELSLESAAEYRRLRNWIGASQVLRPLWEDMSFRVDSWMNIAGELGWLLREAAFQTGQLDLLVAIDWALLNRRFSKQPNWHYDITRSLEGRSTSKRPLVKTKDNIDSPFASPSFIFEKAEGKAGHTCTAQLSLTSNAVQGSVPIVLKELRVQFEGSIRPIVIRHVVRNDTDSGPKGPVSMSLLSLAEEALERDEEEEEEEEDGDEEGSFVLAGSADLTFPPGSTRAFQVNIHLREPGEAAAVVLELSLQCDDYDLEHTMRFTRSTAADSWYMGSISKKRVAREYPHIINILPRPPNMEIRVLGLSDHYYTNESIELPFEIINAEDVDANLKLDATIAGSPAPGFCLRVEGLEIERNAQTGDELSRLSGLPLGTLESKKTVKARIIADTVNMTSKHDVTIQALYSLVSDPATPIIQTTKFQLNIIQPFEANYNVTQRLHTDPWPSLFDADGLQVLSKVGDDIPAPRGLMQRWCLATQYASFASEDLQIIDLDIHILSSPGSRCTISKVHELPPGGRQISPNTTEAAEFDLVGQKHTLDDRSSSALDVAFVIQWKRLGGAAVNTTTLPVPRLFIFGYEPRVLAAASYSSTRGGLMVVLDVVIENASNHFLTFGLTLETSEQFAFSGPKQTTLNLLPASRRSVTYRLVPLERGEWIKPALVVKDKYFQKVLAVIPTEGMKRDKDGILIWIPPEEEEAEGEEKT